MLSAETTASLAWTTCFIVLLNRTLVLAQELMNRWSRNKVVTPGISTSLGDCLIRVQTDRACLRPRPADSNKPTGPSIAIWSAISRSRFGLGQIPDLHLGSSGHLHYVLWNLQQGIGRCQPAQVM